ncbi:Uncharacterised protein [Vibrio cholerae]|nr:Uncharacterised protein [Vibrio cholerae]
MPPTCNSKWFGYESNSLNESCRPLLLIRIGEGLCISKLFNDIFPHTVALPSWF